ncbi:MAG TPA: DUF2344 domain-containing protein [Clostridiaceae bacterium]|nr:DUF2344 domain-containing protein [Clostridiaceae bacterium]
MSSIRVKFTRGDEVKYISHLDMMKAFERALRRSGLPISYSQGFNPHPKMVFGLPLSVGVTSEAEYADFELEEIIETREFMERLNSQLPSGLKIIDAREKKTKGNIMAEICRASYSIRVISEKDTSLEEINKGIEQFMNKQEIIVKKETKSKVKDTDIRKMIFFMQVLPLDLTKNKTSYNMTLENMTSENCSNKKTMYELKLTLSAGSKANLKPELLIEAFNSVSGQKLIIKKIHRTELFVDINGKASDPMIVC